MDVDALAKTVQALIQATTNQDVWIALGNLTSFDPTTYRAQVSIKGKPYGPLPLIVPALGWAPAHAVGAPVVVACEAGTPVAIIGPYYTTDQPIPLGAASIEGDVSVQGKLTAELMLQPPVFGALPAATTDWANTLVVVSASGSASTLHLCVDNGDSTYTWRQVTLS